MILPCITNYWVVWWIGSMNNFVLLLRTLACLFYKSHSISCGKLPVDISFVVITLQQLIHFTDKLPVSAVKDSAHCLPCSTQVIPIYWQIASGCVKGLLVFLLFEKRCLITLANCQWLSSGLWVLWWFLSNCHFITLANCPLLLRMSSLSTLFENCCWVTLANCQWLSQTTLPCWDCWKKVISLFNNGS